MRKNIHKILLLCVSLIFNFQLSIFNSAQAQIVPDSYRQQKQQEMSRFADSVNDSFARYLEHLWTEYQLFNGEPSPRSVKPVEQPRLDTMVADDTIKNDSQILYGRLTDVQKTGVVEFLPPSSIANIQKRNYTVQFYGQELTIALPVEVANLNLEGIRERHVARYWKKLVENHASQCVASLDQQRRNMYLGDWGLFDLIRHFVAAVYPDRANEQAVFAVYLLDAMRYDARVGRMDDRLVMLVNTGSRLYDIPYVEIDTVRYYAFGDVSRKGRLHTYDRQMASADRPVDLNLAYSPRIGGALSSKAYSYTLSGRKVSFRVNQPLMDFYACYPQTELSVYANAAMEEAFAAAIEREMRPFVEGQSPVGALNALLEFMQKGFVYQTDRKQFGREKNFFCEENFHYPANDCEDRAVLFARMVTMLLGYDVVLLEYTDHVSTAVCIPGRKAKGQHLEIKGKRYMVCDPTCIGAAVGDLSRKYRNKSPNIIVL
ncbi:MAG: hypothetical protein K6F85_04580 [Bacteroidales bacterium]|nr:hypothetical protein [Bacteroidales bacterium]